MSQGFFDVSNGLFRPQVPVTGHDLPYPQGLQYERNGKTLSTGDPHDTYTVEVAKAPSASKKSDNFISWSAFLKEYLPQIVEKLSPAYEEDFRTFCIYNMAQCVYSENLKELRREFMAARVLFDLLKNGGLWGFYFVIPPVQRWHGPSSLLEKLGVAAEREDSVNAWTLFEADCDEISFLYAEMAAHLGLKTEVRLIQDNHVNIFVKVGGVELRMDLTGVCGYEGTSWMLPPNNYVPEKGIPETYAKTGLEPSNKHYRQGRAVHGEGLKNIYLSSEAFNNLFARAGVSPPHLLPKETIQKWKDFVNGYRHARECHTDIIVKYFHPTLDAAEAAAREPGYKQRWKRDVESYFDCLKEPASSKLWELGIALGHYLINNDCTILPPKEDRFDNDNGSPDNFVIDFISCQAMMPPMMDPLMTLANIYHNQNGVPQTAESEFGYLLRRLEILSEIDPGKLEYPETNNLGHWFNWLYTTAKSDPSLFSALGYLLHVIEVHQNWVQE